MAEHGKILLVEDDPNDVELMQIALAQNNLAPEVVVTRDGAEALDYLYRREAFAARKNNSPVVVLLDLKLPKIGGLEVLRTLKSDATLKTIPVVMLSSSREDSDLEACYQAGANAYVVKPVGFPKYEEMVKTIVAFWAQLNEPPLG